jgi:hypothetical protein
MKLALWPILALLALVVGDLANAKEGMSALIVTSNEISSAYTAVHKTSKGAIVAEDKCNCRVGTQTSCLPKTDCTDIGGQCGTSC